MVSEGHSNASEPLAASLGPTLAPAPAHLQDMIRTSAAYHTGCKDSDQGIMQRQCLSSLGVSKTHNRVIIVPSRMLLRITYSHKTLRPFSS